LAAECLSLNYCSPQKPLLFSQAVQEFHRRWCRIGRAGDELPLADPCEGVAPLAAGGEKATTGGR
jgi:hypothetical protein